MTTTTRLPGLPVQVDKPSIETRDSGLIVARGYRLREHGKLARRRLYKPQRSPARFDDRTGEMPPVGMPDATAFEITSSINAYAKVVLKIDVGRTNGYDAQKDEYSVIAKAGRWERPRDYKIPGADISLIIYAMRLGNGSASQPMDPQMYLKQSGAI